MIEPVGIYDISYLMQLGWYLHIVEIPNVMPIVYEYRMTKTFRYGDGTEHTYDQIILESWSGDRMNPPIHHSWYEQAASWYGGQVEYAERLRNYVPNPTPFTPTRTMFFSKEELYQWISPQQMSQFEKMYPDCVYTSYLSAVGYVKSQIGQLYDMDAILNRDPETDSGTLQIMTWILTVLTAYNLSSPSMKHSQVLLDNYDMVVKKVTEMKTGFTTIAAAPTKTAPNAWGEVVNKNKNKMLG